MKRFPPIPKTMYGIGGPITVKIGSPVKGEKGDDAWGTWEPSTRTIELEEKSPREHQWRVLYHEMMHSMLADSGLVNLFTDEMQESLCDAAGTARMAEMRGRRTGNRTYKVSA